MILVVLLAGLALDVEVARLDDPDPAERMRARAALVRAGDEAAELLEAAVVQEDPEVRRQVNGILDELFEKSLEGERRYPAYRVPENQMTRQLRQIRGVQPQLLGHDAFFKAVAQHYQGSLKDWKNPTLVDYHHLLRDYTRRMHDVAHATDGTVLETTLATNAIVWRVSKLKPGLGRDHWTTRWLLRREVLPLLQASLRSKSISKAEFRLLYPVIDHVRPIALAAPKGSPLRISFADVEKKLRRLRPR